MTILGFNPNPPKRRPIAPVTVDSAIKWMLKNGITSLEIDLLPVPDEPGCYNAVLLSKEGGTPVLASQGLWRPDDRVLSTVEESYIRESLDE